MPMVVGRHEYVIKIRRPIPPSQLRLRLAMKASTHHALYVVAMRTLDAEASSNILVDGDQR